MGNQNLHFLYWFATSGVIIIWNCLIDFAVEHRFGCRATEPGFAGDIGAIEV